MSDNSRAPRNRTIALSGEERAELSRRLVRLERPIELGDIVGRTICQDLNDAIPYLPTGFVDLMIVDPPYNISKSFNGRHFNCRSDSDYASWLESWLLPLKRTLKPTASVYVCAEWGSSGAVYEVAVGSFVVRNRITWEREKGRGALKNWKNCSEDIWFLTCSDSYTFNVDAVKLRRRVIAPYVDSSGRPKDWNQTDSGGFRDTCPSNIWTDLSVPFWSMRENTAHPTQKPEKLIAKLILASSHVGDVVLDPFAGSGTTSVVAKKLGRQFVGVEVDEYYCCLCEARLALADSDPSIQGYDDGVFWERNTLTDRHRRNRRAKASSSDRTLFE